MNDGQGCRRRQVVRRDATDFRSVSYRSRVTYSHSDAHGNTYGLRVAADRSGRRSRLMKKRPKRRPASYQGSGGRRKNMLMMAGAWERVQKCLATSKPFDTPSEPGAGVFRSLSLTRRPPLAARVEQVKTLTGHVHHFIGRSTNERCNQRSTSSSPPLSEAGSLGEMPNKAQRSL